MSILSRPQVDIRLFFERLLPSQPCSLCGLPSHIGPWCAACDATLPRLPAQCCPVCALPTPNGETCGRCQRHPPAFDATVACFAYAYPLDRLLQAYKFGHQFALAPPLARQLLRQSTAVGRPDGLIALPLHPRRLRERGFNQSLLLARQLGRSMNVPVHVQGCMRLRDTPPQSSLGWRARRKNMHAAFECTLDLSGQHVALVDDVMTTGASLDALAHAVRQAGAAHVSAWVLARTLPQS